MRDLLSLNEFSQIDARRMKFQIYFVGEGCLLLPIRKPPSPLESVEALPPALGAGPMPSVKRNGFVEEEQLRIPMRRHYDTMPSPKFQNARNPAPTLVA